MSQQTFNFTDLDYDQIRASIVEHLKSKTEFQDFNFEGAGISLLIDALAYTTTYMAVHANMAVAETFIDSAQLRNSLVSKAKELNYMPRSMQSPYIETDIVFTHPKRDEGEGLGQNLAVPRGTKFSVNIGTNTFDFVTIQQYQFTEEFDGTGLGGIYRARIRLYEGKLITHTDTAPISAANRVSRRFRIPQQNIDTRFLSVQTETQGGEVIDWQNFSNVVSVGPDTPAYYIQEGLDGYYEIYFGDGIIATILPPGAKVHITYLVTHGPDSHGIGKDDQIELESMSALHSANQVMVDDDIDIEHFGFEASEPARDGALREDNESIRLSAPRAYTAQNRAVTRDDYITILQNKYGFIKTMSVWGGEDNDPPRFGSTFVCIKPTQGQALSPITKQMIEEDLVANYSVVSITPRLVDPDTVFAFVQADVAYRSEETSLSQGQIVQNVQNSIKQFFENKISFFNRTLRQSRLLRVIDDSDRSIQGSSLRFKLAKKFRPDNTRAVEVQLKYYNPLVPGTVRSNVFKNNAGSNLQLIDNSKGRMHLYVNGRLSLRDIAVVNYENGTVLINGLRSTETRRFIFRVPDNTEVVLEAEPVNKDLRALQAGIIELDVPRLNIQLKRLTFIED